MAYFKPYIDETGIHIPTYSDIRDFYLDQARAIFGEDVYLDIDSQDYQMIAQQAELASDVNDLAVQVYNNRAPTTAIGSALDGIVKLNGIRRKGASQSICAVIVRGDPGTKITNGIVADTNDHRWFIGDVEIPSTGEKEVAATCLDAGPVYADAGTIIRIVTQTRGWLAVNNIANATPGQNIEADATLRSRQAISTANPSRTVLEGTIGGIAALQNVVRYKVYENDTNIDGYYGPPVPGHHISCVVEGGDDKEIASIIYLRKTPGGGTFGDVEIDIKPTETALESSKPIRFFRPRYVDVYVEIQVRTFAGYVSKTEETMIDNVQNYLNALRIGTDLTVSALYVPAMAATPSITEPVFSIQQLTIGTSEDNLTTDNLAIEFNQVTRGIREYIKVVKL